MFYVIPNVYFVLLFIPYSVPETIKENSTFRAKGLRREVNSQASCNSAVLN